MRSRHVPALLVIALAVAAGCGDDDEAGADEPAAVEIRFWSGSIPPPYNHEYALDLTLGADGIEAGYRLVYNYRDELAELPPDADENLSWQGALDGATAAQARALAADPGLQEPEDDGAVGGSSWDIAVLGAGGERTAAGSPTDTDAWRALGCAVDAQARRELGREGAAQSC